MKLKQIELLAPAGSMEALQAAVQNGCDAVYLGGKMFGARASASNFDNEQMIEAIAYAHVYGVKVYVTMNTLMYDHEIEDALSYAYFLYTHDVDAVIVQDLGLLDRIRVQIPQLEVHASTQMHVHNEAGITYMRDIGVKRVVLPRETPLAEIQQYSALGVDLEVFVHGAICVSYSGQCYMSSLLYDRSGNRGACAQPCRMQYQLCKEENGKVTTVKSIGSYLLSPKDLNTLAYIPELIDAGVTSFKIEGRMKRPEYVAQVVSLYRKAIDAYKRKESFEVDKETEDAMKKVFHRGFTQGHIFQNMGSRLMNPIRPNHIGVPIGYVMQAHGDRIRIQLKEDLYQGDGIRILDKKEDKGFVVNKLYKNGKLVNSACKGDVVEVEHQGFVEKQSTVLKTSDVHQLKALQQSYLKTQRKVKIRAHIQMFLHQPLSLYIVDQDEFAVELQSEACVEKALKTPLDKERIIQQIKKCGDTPFMMEDVHVDMDEGCTISIKELNHLRRNALDALLEQRKTRYTYEPLKVYEKKVPHKHGKKHIVVVVRTQQQYEACVACGIDNVFIQNIATFHQLRKQGFDVSLHTGRVHKLQHQHAGMIAEVGGLLHAEDTYADFSFNITNAYAAGHLFSQKVRGITLSIEHTDSSRRALLRQYKDLYGTNGCFGIIVYGYDEMMVSEYCAMNACEKDSDKKNCGLCRKETRYMLENMKKERYPLYGDEQCRMHVLHHTPRNVLHNLDRCAEEGITYVQCNFTIENKEETLQVLQQVKKGWQ